jgi:hypothetical protein
MQAVALLLIKLNVKQNAVIMALNFETAQHNYVFIFIVSQFHPYSLQ